MSSLLLTEVTSLLTGLVGLSVWLKNRRSGLFIYFGLFACSVGLWTSVNGLVHAFGDTSWGLIWARLAFASASLIGLSFLLFAASFTSSCPPAFIVAWMRPSWVAVGAAFALLSFTPLMVTDTTMRNNALVVSYGPLHLPFAVFFLSSLASGLYILNTCRKRSSGAERMQTTYLLGAVLCAGAGASVTNLWLPLVFGNSEYGQYSPIFSLLLVILIAHGIIRHRLMDIKVIIKRGTVHLAAYLIAAAALFTLLIGLTFLLRDVGLPTLHTLALSLAVATLLHPLKETMRAQIDRYLYREPYHFQSIVRDASRALGSTIELRSLFECLGGPIRGTLRPSSMAVYLLDELNGSFSLAWHSGPRSLASRVWLSGTAVELISKTRAPIFRNGPLHVNQEQRDLVLDELAELGTEAVAPLVEANVLIGLLVLGPKPFDNPYFCDDADLLATLANQSAVAIRNAQTHQRVVQLNEELQTVLSTIESGVVAVGGRGEIRLFNRAAERFTGVPAATARGQSVQHLPPPLARCIAGTLADGEPRSQAEFFLPDSAGQLVPLVCSTSPLLSSADQLAGVVAVLNDISHLKQLEHEKRRAERLASIEAIAAGLVHEIRNPLVAVKTFTQLLPTRYHDAEYRESCARTVGREIRRIDNLLTRFRTLASASSESMEMVDVREPMRHALEVLQPQLDERRVHVRQVSDGRPRRIVGNVSQLEQLFLNLCLNALEAMAPEGELTLRVADLSEGGGTTLLVEVSDTGTGIPEDLLAKIFDPFVSSKARGSGLGLAICRAVADAHHARLTARNNEGRPGSTFTVEFPVPLAQATTPAVT